MMFSKQADAAEEFLIEFDHGTHKLFEPHR